MSTMIRRRAGLGLAAGLLGAGLALSGAGTAMADGPPGPPEDKISMACKAVKSPTDPGVAAALSLYGIQSQDVTGEVGFFCTPTEDPAVANFCAVDNQRDAFLALGNKGACPGGV